MKYISADELKRHWQILDFELLKYIQDGLRAYDRLGRKTITDSEVKHEREETIDEFRQRLLLRETKHEISKIEKNSSAEYVINTHRLIDAGKLDHKLPEAKVYDAEEVRKRVEKRLIEEYDQIPSFPAVPPGLRLISAELNDSELRKILHEIKTFHFKIEDLNEFGRLHELKLINELEESTQEDATAEPAPAALPEGNTIVRRAQAMAIANAVKKDFPKLTVNEAAKQINARLAEMGAFDKDGKPLMLGYSEKYLMRIIKGLKFKLGKPGRKSTK